MMNPKIKEEIENFLVYIGKHGHKDLACSNAVLLAPCDCCQETQPNYRGPVYDLLGLADALDDLLSEDK